jgi:hypothetical protein
LRVILLLLLLLVVDWRVACTPLMHMAALPPQVSCKEQREIEQQLAAITERMKMEHFCQALQFHNVLTYKQLAGVYVNAWPFIPDALSGEYLA